MYVLQMYIQWSLSGHSLQWSPPLMWPQIYATATVNAVLPPNKGHLPNAATISCNRVASLEVGLLYKAEYHFSLVSVFH